MAEIKTNINVNDVVYWVHCSGKVYKGKVQEISLCEYQGALYCHIYSPSFKRNPYPSVHYSNVFHNKDTAKEYAVSCQENSDNVFPMCMGCHYRKDSDWLQSEVEQ